MKQKSSGFTLAELMVTISIFTLLITAFYSGTSKTFQNRSNIRDEISTIQTMISTARNMAITSKGVSEEGSTSTVVPQYGYGVHVYLGENAGKNETIVTLFANTEIGDNGTPDDFTDDDFNFSAGDTVLSTYDAFEKGAAQGVNTQIKFIQNDGTLLLEKVTKSAVSREFTLLFYPLSASPVILFNNDSTDTDYQGYQINFFAENLIEEELHFNTISRFVERERVCPATSASPQDCSSYSIL